MNKKILNGFAAMLLVAAIAVPTHADIITTLIGDQSFAPVHLGLDNPSNAVNVGGVLHVTGFSDGIGALQTIDLTTGVAGSVQQFHSLNGLGGRSSIEGVTQLNDGRVVYLGSSAFGANPIAATYWIDGTFSPISAASSNTFASDLEGASGNGTIIGFFEGNASFGTVGSTLSPLPGSADLAVDITSDAQYIVGDSIWELGVNGYETVNTLGFDTPLNSSGLPTQYSGVSIDPVTGQAVFAGAYVDQITFETNTGFWNEDGTFLGTFTGEFQDFEVWEGQLVAGLNGFDDGHLLAISDFSSLSFTEITGQSSMLMENGLFVGSAGFLLDGPDGAFVTTYETPNAAAVPEASSFLLGLIGLLSLRFRRNTQSESA